MIETIKLNSVLGNLVTKPVPNNEYDKLVSMGQILVCEKVGREKNRALTSHGRPAEDFAYACNSAAQFEEKCREWTDDVLYFAASKACSVIGKACDRNDRSTFTDVSLATDPIFLKVINSHMFHWAFQCLYWILHLF